MKKSKSKKNLIKIDIILLVLFPIFAVISSLSLHTSFFVSTLLFFGLPSAYLSYRTPNAIKRVLFFTIPFAILSGITIETLAQINKQWAVSTSFPYKLFGNIIIEQLLWGFLIAYTIIIFYEHFLDKGYHAVIGNRSKYLIYFLLTVSLITITTEFTNVTLLRFPYMYLITGIAFLLLPASTFMFFYPRFIAKFIKTAPYFFYITFLEEITELQLRQWKFPNSSYIGWVNISGFKFPIEEFFFFICIFSICVLSYFEFFDDNRLRRK